MQSSRDWYREVTFDIGMHAGLVELWMRTAALLVLPIAPHFSEHVWCGILGEKRSVQWALWPEIGANGVEEAVIEAGAYLRGTVKMIRDTEISLQKKALKGKGASAGFDSKKDKALRVFVATRFPEWQDASVQVVKDVFEANNGTLDDGKIRDALVAKGLIKDKRIMPFVHNLKVRESEFNY
jgi:leucyl-tRNA synthetase